MMILDLVFRKKSWAIETETDYGKHWSRYDNEADFRKALDETQGDPITLSDVEEPSAQLKFEEIENFIRKGAKSRDYLSFVLPDNIHEAHIVKGDDGSWRHWMGPQDNKKFADSDDDCISKIKAFYKL